MNSFDHVFGAEGDDTVRPVQIQQRSVPDLNVPRHSIQKKATQNQRTKLNRYGGWNSLYMDLIFSKGDKGTR